MASGAYRFQGFLLDPAERRLSRAGEPVELSARYLDALALLVRESGKLVSKDRFMDEIWRGIPVTDEALTQCIRTLRRQLGDDATRPRFIETVPKHGYRFVAPVESAASGTAGDPPPVTRPAAEAAAQPWRDFLLLGGAGTLGGLGAGVGGGLIYGFAGASQPLQPGMGAASVLAVLVCLTVAAAVTGGAGVSFGIAAAGFGLARPGWLAIVGGAVGGLAVGGFVKLLGLDAFNLLLGRSPGEITGAGEGALLGGAVGLGVWLAGRIASVRNAVAAAAAAGALAGMLIPLLGGRLMAGSLDALSRTFPGSRLRLDEIGALFGESGFGKVSGIVTGALEGALFTACVVAAMVFARRRLDPAA